MAARPPKAKASAGGGGNRDRGPPPTLFLHPSPQASHVSLPGRDVPGPASSAPSTATTTTAPALSTAATTATVAGTGKMRDLTSITSPTSARDFASGPGTNPRRTPAYPLHHAPSISSLASIPPLRAARSSDRTDALWAEMQVTLEEVEFTATGSTHVFRVEHEKKLAELRAAQIALAQVWARSEADEVIEMELGAGAGSIDGQGGEVRNLKGTVLGSEGEGGTDQARSAGSTARPESSGMDKGAGIGVERLGRMEEETEVDILLARRRREANDRYFQRVNQGVVNVVAKLADVAEAMRKVEQESKNIWGENDSAIGNEKL